MLTEVKRKFTSLCLLRFSDSQIIAAYFNTSIQYCQYCGVYIVCKVGLKHTLKCVVSKRMKVKDR